MIINWCLSLFILMIATAAHADIKDGLVGCWRFDEGSGTLAVDSGLTYNGTLENGAGWAMGKIGGSLSLNGGSSNAPTAMRLSNSFPSLGDFTFSVWVKGSYTHWNNTLMGDGSNNNRFMLRNSEANFVIGGVVSPSSMATSSNANEWVHVVIVREGTTASYYRNNQKIGSWSVPNGPVTFRYLGTDNMYYGGNSFIGLLEDVHIYNRALSNLEISELFQDTATSTIYNLPQDRVIVWAGKAGLDPVGGIPNYTNVTCAGLHPDNSVDDAATINHCIANASLHSAVFIPAGSYKINKDIFMKSGVVLRGASTESPWLPAAQASNVTILNMNGTKIFFRGGDKTFNWSPGAGLGTDIVSGYVKDSTQLTLAGASTYGQGDYISIFQGNDPAIIDTRGYSWLGEDLSQSGGKATKQQYAKIIAKTGNVITLDTPIYYVTPNAASYSPQVRKQIFGIAEAGVENLKLNGNGSNYRLIWFQFTRHSWVKNVETYNAGCVSDGSPHIWIQFSYGLEIRDNYIHHGSCYSSGSNYGIEFYNWNSKHKVENNVLLDLRHSIVFEGGNSGSVVLYNYSNNNQEKESAGILTQDLTPSHGAFPHMNLWEGNIGQKIMADYTQGSSAYNTLFRNWSMGDRDTPSFLMGTHGYDYQTAFEFGPYVRYYNLVGNVAGNSFDPIWSSGTSILKGGEIGKAPIAFKFGYHTDGTFKDASTYDTALIHGNFDYVTQHVSLWQLGVPKNLPSSLYYVSKPSWFGSSPFPLIGPDVSGYVNKVPAQICFEQGKMPNCLEETVSTLVPGDVSGDGKVTMYDAALVLRFTLGSSLTDAQKTAADKNGDGKIDGADVVAIAKKGLGL